MAIGLLILVLTGKENLYLSYNPEITFLKLKKTHKLSRSCPTIF